MQAWSLKSGTTVPTQAVSAALISAVGREHFATQALGNLNDLLTVGSWAVYRLWPNQPPIRYLSASHGIADTTQECFATYRDEGLYRNDRSFAAVRSEQGASAPVMLKIHADDVPNPLHRRAIYRRHDMVERLSVARIDVDGSLLAVNLYRHGNQGCFTDAEVENFARVAPTVMAAVSRHVEWMAEHTGAANLCGNRRAALKHRCTTLTERELDVLERLLQGMTYDGIAADLGLGVPTVKTYRARAFDRLGIHFKNELFAKFLT